MYMYVYIYIYIDSYTSLNIYMFAYLGSVLGLGEVVGDGVARIYLRPHHLIGQRRALGGDGDVFACSEKEKSNVGSTRIGVVRSRVAGRKS